MPLPRITGLLNNCALNTALPTLLDVIQKLADREVNQTLGALAANPVIQKYQALKTVFANHYGIQAEAFNWEAFNAYLTQHSFYAKEIILAPVMRLFIGEIALASGGYPDGVSGLSEVQDAASGRYYTLDYNEAAQLFHHQFGISVHLFKLRGTVPEFVGTRATMEIDYPFEERPTVNFYRSGGEDEHHGHFEILPPGALLDEASRLFIDEINALPEPLGEIHEGLTTSMSAERSHHFLNVNLQRYVRASISALMADIANRHPDAPRVFNANEFIIGAEEYVINGAQYHDNTLEGRRTFAMILLGIRFEGGDRRAQTLLDNIKYLSESSDRFSIHLLERLVSSIILSKANLTDQKVLECQVAVEVLNKTDHYLQSVFEDDACNKQSEVLNIAVEIIETSWSAYIEQNDKDYLSVIENTLTILTKTTSDNVEEYRELMRTLQAKCAPQPEAQQGVPQDSPTEGSFAQRVAGLMLTLLGIVATAGFAGAYAMGFVLSVPVTLVGVALGIGIMASGYGFFRAGQGSGSNKEGPPAESTVPTHGDSSLRSG